MTAIDRDAVLALLDRVIADPGQSPAAGALALVLRMQVERLPLMATAPVPTLLTGVFDTTSTSVFVPIRFVPIRVHIDSDATDSAFTGGVGTVTRAFNTRATAERNTQAYSVAVGEYPAAQVRTDKASGDLSVSLNRPTREDMLRLVLGTLLLAIAFACGAGQ